MKKLETTKNIIVNSILRVYKKGFGYAKLEIIDVNDYFFGTLTDKELLTNINDGDKLEAYLWVKNVASFEFTIEVIGIIGLSRHTRSGPGFLFFRHTDDIIRNEGRKCLKAKVDIPIKFFIFNTRKNEKSFTSEKVTFNHGKVVELGDREAVIQSRNELPDNVFLKGRVKIGNEDIELVGKIDPLNVKNEKLYNIFFTGMIEKNRNRLLDYVFSVYRE